MTTKIILNNIADSALATLTGPKVTTIVYPGDDTATDIAGGATINLTGNGFQSGCSVLVASTASSVVTFISATQISFIAPALSAGTYVIYVINPDGGTAISIPGISYSGTPNWTTAAGTLGTAYETGAINTTLTATGDDPITYTLASGTLPPGSTLNSNGTLSGTAQATASATTYSFTISANDAQNQTTNRSFSLTINPDVVTWSNPSDNTTYTVAKDTAISNVTMSATSAAGGSITYTADTLPTGLSITGANIAGTPTVTANTSTVLTATSTSTRTATRTINWVVQLGNDIYFNSTTLLLPGNANTFVRDASANNFAVTVAGDTRPNTFNPYLTGWSNYFDGSEDYIQVGSSNTGVTFGTADFTIEAWVYWNSLSSESAIMVGNGVGWTFYVYPANKLQWGTTSPQSGANLLTGNTTLNTGTWYHIAVTRASGTVTLWVNGVSDGTVADSANYSASGDLRVGRSHSGQSFNGYMSNVRVVKGTAVYTTAFTPPTAPLTATTGTSLLTCQSNRFIDNSTNNFTITRNGDVSVQSFSPFAEPATTRGSAYFDGNGDYLTVAENTALDFGTGDFTVEAWVYPINNGQLHPTFLGSITGWSAGASGHRFNNTGYANKFWFGLNGSGGIASGDPFLVSNNTFSFNTWHHYSVTRSGNTFRMFVNGVLENTQTFTGSYNAGLGGLRSGWSTWDGANGYWTGSVSNLRLVKGTALYTADFTPPTEPLTAVAGTSLLTLQTNQPVNNSQFLDSSTNNLLVTRAGNASQGTFSPYSPAGWSNYFDGSGDLLNIPDSAVFDLAAGDWTIETWFNLSALPASGGVSTFVSQWRSSSSISLAWFTYLWNDGGTYKLVLNYSTNGTTQVVLSVNLAGPPAIGSWNHVAFVRSGNNFLIFLNGTQVGSTQTLNAIIFNSTTPVWIGAQNNGGTVNYPFNGYLSNLRIVKGTAVYTANFTPSTTPLTAIAGTSLLTCQSPQFVDNSPNRFAITLAGDVRVTNFAPFKAPVQTPVSYSAYFDGNGDYLTVPASANFQFPGDFTIEGWMYFTNTTGGSPQALFSVKSGGTEFDIRWFTTRWQVSLNAGSGTDIGTTPAPVNNAWTHVACVRSGSTIRLYVNGVATATTITNSNTLGQAASVASVAASNGGSNIFTGYISNIRVVKGTAVYTSNFTPGTQPLTAIANTSLLTCQSPTFVDNSTNQSAITAVGNSQPTTVNPFGSTFAVSTGYTAAEYGGSMYFDGSGDYLDLPNNTAFSQVGSWTLELWVYPTAAQNNYVYSQNTANFLQININGTMSVLVDRSAVGTLITSTSPILLNAWTHLALVSDGTNMKLFVNGTQSGSTASVGTQASSATTTRIGAYQGTGSLGYAGYISNFRLVKGRALYTSNFALPIAPVQPIPNTTLLLNGAGAAITDATTKNVLETVGDVRISTAVAKFGSSSMFFDGTGDYLEVKPINSSFAFGTGNFTIEGWYYSLVYGGNYALVGKGPNDSDDEMLILLYGGQYYVDWGPASGAFMQGGSWSANTWNHFALVRNGTNLTLYHNGVAAISVSNVSATSFTDAHTLKIGVARNGSFPFNGYMQDVRITKGVARYTENFTPPTTEFKTF